MWLPDALKYFSIASWVYLILTACVKLTFLFFYRRVFTTRTIRRYFIDSAIVFITLLNLALLIATVFECTPVQREWNPLIPGHCFNPVILPYFSGISSSATDIYVLVLPITLLWGLNMNMQRKLRLTAIFSLGILSVASSLVRLAETPSLRTSPDATWTISNIVVWAALEVNVGIICSCFTILPAFFERHTSSTTKDFLSRLFSSSSSKRKTDDADPSAKAISNHWSRYEHLGDSETQNLAKCHPENNILQTNTFSMGEFRGYNTNDPGNALPWAETTSENKVHSVHVQTGGNIG
ncbi:hypothetical protein GGR55DRAFT_640494 [Xylaria sp. FL0064]|nr:hypothetical protein GGR55DRAFT_640494 [Xylaria sp. FL0064]